MRALDRVVYYVAIDGLVKIGCTDDLARRLSHLGAERDHLLAVVPGDFAVEREHLARWAHLLVRGREWFSPGADLVKYVNDLRAAAGVRPTDIF